MLFSAGAIRRDSKSTSVDVLSSTDEERIISDAFKGSILPKLLKEDAAILLDLLEKTFIVPVVSSQPDADFNNSLALSCETLHLFPSPPWIEKILQIKQLARFDYFRKSHKSFFLHWTQYPPRYHACRPVGYREVCRFQVSEIYCNFACISLYYARMLQGCIASSNDCRCLLHAVDVHTSSVSHVYVIDPKSVKKEELYGTFSQTRPSLISYIICRQTRHQYPRVE